MTAIGTFLPWATVGGRSRSGFSTADTFIDLAAGSLPNWIAWIGRWWYLPAFLVVVAWASVFAGGRRLVRLVGVASLAAAAILWWAFVWACHTRNVLAVDLAGPIVTTAGIAVIGGCCSVRRGSVLAALHD